MALPCLMVPVPVGLHPGLVDAKLLPIFVAWTHMIGNPIKALVLGVAVGAQGRGYLVPVLVAAVDVYVVGQVNLFRSDVEAREFKVFAAQASKHIAGAVDIPVQGLQAVLYACKVQGITPVCRGGLLVGEIPEHYGVGDSDDDAPLARGGAYPGCHICAGLFQLADAASLAQPKVQLILPDALVGRFSRPQHHSLVVHPVAAFQKKEALEKPLFASVGGLPAHVRGKACGIPMMRLAVPVAHEVQVLKMHNVFCRTGEGCAQEQGGQQEQSFHFFNGESIM